MSLDDAQVDGLKAFFQEPIAGPKPEGRRLGRYRLLEPLGEGATAVVYRARDEDLRRDVAIKMLKTVPSLSPQLVERFHREEQAAAKLRHPNIVTLYEAGVDGDALYYTMELVPGLAFDPRQGALEDRVRILEKTARGVHHAHTRGILHRDLKPANILIDVQGEPRVLDFGLSRDLGLPSDLTRPGSLFGTPLYMSPEQAEGTLDAIDARTDVYALGAILYEVLAGRPPFDGATASEIAVKVVRQEAALPPGPRDLAAAALRAIEKSPARRYPSAEAFADDLARYLAGQPTQARPLSAPLRLWRASRRHRAAAVALSAVLAIGVFAGLSVSQPPLPPDPVETLLRSVPELAPSPRVGGTGGTAFLDAAPGRPPLTGLRIRVFSPDNPHVIQSLQPLYGAVAGTEYGSKETAATDAVAKPGYAVGAIRVRSEQRLLGLELRFMRIVGDRLDPADAYSSRWFGGTQGVETTLGGDGRPIAGIYGRAGADIDSFGVLSGGARR